MNMKAIIFFFKFLIFPFFSNKEIEQDVMASVKMMNKIFNRASL